LFHRHHAHIVAGPGGINNARFQIPLLYRAALICLFVCMAFVRTAGAADPQPYNVTIEASVSSEIRDLLNSTSLLVTLRESAPVPPFGLIARATGDVQRLETVLNSFGHYKPSLTITIEGRALDDPMLPSVLDQVPQGMPVNVQVAIEEGPLYRLRRITLDGMIPPAARTAFGLMPGAPAIAANVLAARDRLLTALQEDGYALATVSEPIAYADDQAMVLDIEFRVETGPQVEIGEISFEGLERVNESFAREALPLHPGERYAPSRIEAARRKLLESGVFASLTVRAAQQVSADGRLPLTLVAQERPLRAVALSGAYSTDLGISLSATWTHRNLFGNAEQLILSAAGTGLWGDATEDVGYLLSARFIKPAFLRPDQTGEVALSAVKQNLQAYRQTAETLGVSLRRVFSPQWTGSVGLNATHDNVAQQGVSYIYQLLALPISATYDSTGLTNPLLDPTRGIRASLIATPTQSFGAQSQLFTILQASASTYFDLSGNGRSVLALRGILGSVLGASTFDLPPDQRLYAGGSGTVRGFRFQSIGPLFPNGDPVGGTAVDAATVEFRQRIGANWGVVGFVDAGQASDEGVPFTGTLRVGAGTGVRYYTPIGVVRADIAMPLNKPPNGDSFGIYIGLGQAF
jgi:translocation and assembly module TamA